MELSDKLRFLVTDYDGKPAQYYVRLVEDYADALASWGPLTRISPVWGVSEFGSDQIRATDFSNAYLVFLGPVRPATLQADLPQLLAGGECPTHLWVTLGAFNVLAECVDEAALDLLSRWATKNNVPFEKWIVESGRIITTENSPRRSANGAHHNGLHRLAKSSLPHELRAGMGEYCALMASALSRAAEVSPGMLKDLSVVNESVNQFVQVASNSDRDLPNAQAILTNINAGLSRFSSQSFSGTAPILGTESHFWYHSLLGICVANMALERLNSFVMRKLGSARIAARLEKLEERKTNVPDLSRLAAADEIFTTDHLAGVALTESDESELRVPLITYFSGRDGFKSHLYTLSAPLATISACNSLRWNLKTITHEMSHVFIRSVISLLYPNIQEPNQINHALRLLNDNAARKDNWLDSIRFYLLNSLFSMQNQETGEFEKEVAIDSDRLKKMLDDWRGEIEEIMAHVFDFLYFHQSNHESYIKGIWLSWGVIPNISNRVREYVMRSVCSALSSHLRREDMMIGMAIDDVRRDLIDLPDASIPTSYVSQAISYIDEHRAHLSARVNARKPIVRIVRAFLYSDSFAKELWDEPRASSHASRTGGYTMKRKVLDETRITNPLAFLDKYTTSPEIDSSQSAWMLNTLAFNIESE